LRGRVAGDAQRLSGIDPRAREAIDAHQRADAGAKLPGQVAQRVAPPHDIDPVPIGWRRARPAGGIHDAGGRGPGCRRRGPRQPRGAGRHRRLGGLDRRGSGRGCDYQRSGGRRWARRGMRGCLSDGKATRVLVIQQQHGAQDRDQSDHHQPQAREQPRDDLSGSSPFLLKELILGHGICSWRRKGPDVARRAHAAQRQT